MTQRPGNLCQADGLLTQMPLNPSPPTTASLRAVRQLKRIAEGRKEKG